ncbi:MAG: hypothetical protein J5710_04740 [Treponema sp.]|nr:hypothetical protein [Treponema sp.]
METPVKNIVAAVDLSSADALLPIFECVVNSIISLRKSKEPIENRKIQITLFRGNTPTQADISGTRTIDGFEVLDNGDGFNDENFHSFQTPYTDTNKQYGCKGIGRFTWLAAFKKATIKSNYHDGNQWKYREFVFDATNEIQIIKEENSQITENKTSVHLENCFNPVIKDKTAVSIEQIAQEIMQHCLIYYLCNELPNIEIIDENNKRIIINNLFERVSKDREKTFTLKGSQFKLYITKSLKENNRKNHYIYFCANSRVVGNPKFIGKINPNFAYPIQEHNQQYFLDVYVVSDYLNSKVYGTRNGFKIPQQNTVTLFTSETDGICFDDIESSIIKTLEQEYFSHVLATQERNVHEIQNYIKQNAPRYNSFLKNPEILKSIPPNLSDDKKEEFLYKLSFEAKKKVDKKLNEVIEQQDITNENIDEIIRQIKERTAYDSDSLADYMCRRKAIIDLFDKFLEADKNGKYKLEKDIHNLIFPMGLTNEEVDYESHNLWLLDERFATYRFISSDKSITSVSQKKSSKEPDLLMFDNPISFGNESSGEISSMVIFEFKRPGDTAHQKNKQDYRWEFSELVDKYFDDFIYNPDKKNYKGRQVVLNKTTPKFGYVIMDVIPKPLEDYNIGKGWKKTPFGTFYKLYGDLNLHIEVSTFDNLLQMARKRHNPFFDKLFGKSN